MSRPAKTLELAHSLYDLSLDANGRVSDERVAAVLEWVGKHNPPHAIAILREYRRLIEAAIARNRAVIEFAGDLSPSAFEAIAETMSRRYDRPIEPVPVPRPELIAGVRVRVGYDIFENTILGQLATLRTAS